MNAILKPRIRDTERTQRQAAIDFARGSVRFEGVVLDAEVERLNRRYIDGELSLHEHTALGLALIDRNYGSAG